MLLEKVQAVEQVFEKLDREISTFQSWSGFHCPTGCGKCCFKSDIEATILEFLPFAHYLYTQNQATSWLKNLKDTRSSICLILNPAQGGAGLCSEYKHRGLICRLFGYSARTDKYGTKELITCKVIKTEQTANFELASSKIGSEDGIPVMSQYYMQLHAIDFELTREFFPINEAIKRAIEVILHYYAYRE